MSENIWKPMGERYFDSNVIPFDEVRQAKSNIQALIESSLKLWSPDDLYDTIWKIIYSRTESDINSFHYQWHLSFWKQIFWPFIQSLNACYPDYSRICFQWKWYYFNCPNWAKITHNKIIALLREKWHLDIESFVWVDVVPEKQCIEVTSQDASWIQYIHSYGYVPDEGSFDPQIWF